MAHDACPMAITLMEDRPMRGTSAIAERPDGSRVTFEPYPTPLHDPEGRLVGGVNVLIDVTDRERAKQALAATAEALALSSTARDDFLGLVSHELRTPVTTIYGNARLLLDRIDRLPLVEGDMVADIAADAERLLGVVENLLLLGRLQAGAEPDLEPQLLRHVIGQHVDEFQRRHPRRIISLVVPDGHAVVEADPTYIGLLLSNLLSNADKYGGTGPIEVVIADDGREGKRVRARPRDGASTGSRWTTCSPRSTGPRKRRNGLQGSALASPYADGSSM